MQAIFFYFYSFCWQRNSKSIGELRTRAASGHALSKKTFLIFFLLPSGTTGKKGRSHCWPDCQCSIIVGVPLIEKSAIDDDSAHLATTLRHKQPTVITVSSKSMWLTDCQERRCPLLFSLWLHFNNLLSLNKLKWKWLLSVPQRHNNSLHDLRILLLTSS